MALGHLGFRVFGGYSHLGLRFRVAGTLRGALSGLRMFGVAGIGA